MGCAFRPAELIWPDAVSLKSAAVEIDAGFRYTELTWLDLVSLESVVLETAMLSQGSVLGDSVGFGFVRLVLFESELSSGVLGDSVGFKFGVLVPFESELRLGVLRSGVLGGGVFESVMLVLFKSGLCSREEISSSGARCGFLASRIFACISITGLLQR